MTLFIYCFSGWNPVCLVDIEADLLVKEILGSQHRSERSISFWRKPEQRVLMVIVFSSPNSHVNK